MGQLKVGRPRPRHLSDPHDEFLGSSADSLLAIPNAQLQWHHYRDLLGPYNPAGAYEEVVYFLPFALDHLILIAHEDGAFDLVTTPIWFASEYDEQLRRDGILEATRDRIRDCFSAWTREFNVVHFDQAACQAKGWGIVYNDAVKLSEVICEGMEDLVRFKSHADLALEFFQSFTAHRGDEVKAAWFLEFARAQTDVYPPLNDPQIRALLNDRQLLASAADVVRSQRLQKDASPTYWNDTFAALDL